MKIVGVWHQPMEQFCYAVNNIEPLHIASGLACNNNNIRYASKENNSDWLKELVQERKGLYKDAKKYGLTMQQINDFSWYNNASEYTNFRAGISNNKSLKNCKFTGGVN